MKKDKSDEWLISDYENRSREDSLGYAYTVSPVPGVMEAIKNFHRKSDGAEGIYEALEKISEATLGADNTSRLEELLFLQAEVLHHVFVRSIAIAGCDNESVVKTYGGLALKAQNQSRRTIIALSEMQNPKRATFIKQQNNANNQQVNNGDLEEVRQPVKPIDGATKKKSLEKKKANELLGELSDGICMDARKTTKAKRSN
jgi:hypothetical protein